MIVSLGVSASEKLGEMGGGMKKERYSGWIKKAQITRRQGLSNDQATDWVVREDRLE